MDMTRAVRMHRLNQFERLIETGDSLRERARHIFSGWVESHGGHPHRAPNRLELRPLPFVEWRAKCVLFLSRFLDEHGPDWHFVYDFGRLAPRPEDLAWGLGTLRALHDALQEGLLDNSEQIVPIAISPPEKPVCIVSDLLGHADEILRGDQGMMFDHVPGAVLASVALERTLWRLCASQSPPVPTRARNGKKRPLERLIIDLGKRNVIPADALPGLEKWARIQRSAYEGSFEAFERSDVASMIEGLNQLLASQDAT